MPRREPLDCAHPPRFIVMMEELNAAVRGADKLMAVASEFIQVGGVPRGCNARDPALTQHPLTELERVLSGFCHSCTVAIL